jgi:hypothetical protein
MGLNNTNSVLIELSIAEVKTECNKKRMILNCISNLTSLDNYCGRWGCGEGAVGERVHSILNSSKQKGVNLAVNPLQDSSCC